MVRNSLILLVFCTLPSITLALGLGRIELNSALNQPFDARVELLSVATEDIQGLNVRLADADALPFDTAVSTQRARVSRLFLLSALKFKVEEVKDGPDYISITSLERAHKGTLFKSPNRS